EVPPFIWSGIKEFVDGRSGTLVAYFLVVGAVSEKQLFVVAQERSRIGAALVPQQYQPPAGLEYTRELPAGTRTVEPVRGLRCRDKGYGLIRNRGRFGASCNAGEVWKARE